MPDQGLPKTWPRRLQVSVRSLMVAVLFLGGGLGALVHVINSARLQRLAADGIRRAGGTVLYDWQFHDLHIEPNGRAWAPKWLVNLLGPDYFGYVTFASLPETASDEDLAHVGPFSRLEVFLHRPGTVTDSGLIHLSCLKSLRFLYLRGTCVTDNGLVHLSGLVGLRALDLRGTKVSDAGLAHLGKLTGLYRLDLRETRVTDSGLVRLTGLINLRQLDLDDTEVTRAGEEWLKLKLHGTAIVR